MQAALDKGRLDELRENVGDDPAFLAELIDDFLVEGPAQLEALRGALSSGDSEHARLAVHTLKGQSRLFGADHLAALCQACESAATAGDVDAVLAQFDALSAEWDRVNAELVSLRDGA